MNYRRRGAGAVQWMETSCSTLFCFFSKAFHKWLWLFGFLLQIKTNSPKDSRAGDETIAMTFICISLRSWSITCSPSWWPCLQSSWSRRWVEQFGRASKRTAKKHSRQRRWTERSQRAVTTGWCSTLSTSSSTSITTYRETLSIVSTPNAAASLSPQTDRVLIWLKGVTKNLWLDWLSLKIAKATHEEHRLFDPYVDSLASFAKII